MTLRNRLVPLAGLCLLLSACAHKPPPPPMTVLAPGVCAPALTVQGAPAVPVLMSKESQLDFGADSACMLLGDGQPTLYSVVRLPDSAEPYLITVRSLPVGEGLIIPRLLLMTDGNQVLRSVEGESFTFHGASMMTKLRWHPGETYLVVAVDTRYVGQAVSQIAESFTPPTTTVIGRTVVSTYRDSGSSELLNYVFSYNGTVVIGAEPMPKA